MGKYDHKDITGAELHVNKAHTHPGDEITTAVDDSDHLEGSTKAQVQDHAVKTHNTTHHLGHADEVNHDLLFNSIPDEHINWKNATENFYTAGTAQIGYTLGVGTAPLSSQLIRAEKSISGFASVSGIYGGPTNQIGSGIANVLGLSFIATGMPSAQSGNIIYSEIAGASIGAQLRSTSYVHTLSATEMYGVRGSLGIFKTTPQPVIATTVKVFWARNTRTYGGAILTTQYAFYDEGMTTGVTDWGFYGLSAQNYLSGTLQTGGYISQDGSAGVSGSFTTADVPAKTITVKNGIITSIV